MVLAIDIGNTNVVLGCFDRDEIRLFSRLATKKGSTSLEYAMSIKSMLEFEGISGQSFEGCIISSVVPSLTNALKSAAELLTGKTPLVLGPGIKTGLRILLDNPSQLGSDRVADTVAASNLYPCPLITVDMGTATTLSVVDAHKNFIGGMIVPGLKVSLNSLGANTAQLPKIGLDPPKNAIGKNTVDCIRSGMIYFTAAGIDGMIEQIEQELGSPCTVIVTGGLSKVVTPYCKHPMIEDDTLLLKGLRMIYYKNVTR